MCARTVSLCLAATAVLVLGGLLPSRASAIPITGTINFAGTFVPIDGGGATSLGSATGIQFNSDVTVKTGISGPT